jgi:hypothetical protein
MKRITLAVLAVTALACGPQASTTNLKGRTTDDTGSQQQGLSSSELGGSGSVSATAKIRVSAIQPDGTLELIGDGAVKSDGSYDVSVAAADTEKVVVQSIDASGSVRASVIVAKSGAQGATTVVSPMTTETSVEAEVLMQLIAQGITLAEANAIDLRARIDSETAAQVKASADVSASVKALAEAIAAAQRAQLKAYAQAGVTTTQSALFEAELSAASSLDTSLDAAGDASAAQKAQDDFVAALQAKVIAAAGDAKKASHGERAASIAFRATIDARLNANAGAVADAAARQAAGLEARRSTAAEQAALTAGSAAQSTLDAFAAAGATLQASLRASSSVTETATAYAAYRASLVGSASVSGSILGDYLGVDATTQLTVQTAVSAVASAGTTLDASLSTAASTSIKASQAIDFDAYADAVVSALQTFDQAAQAQATSLAAFGSKADVAVELMAQANGSLRVMQ